LIKQGRTRLSWGLSEGIADSLGKIRTTEKSAVRRFRPLSCDALLLARTANPDRQPLFALLSVQAEIILYIDAAARGSINIAIRATAAHVLEVVESHPLEAVPPSGRRSRR